MKIFCGLSHLLWSDHGYAIEKMIGLLADWLTSYRYSRDWSAAITHILWKDPLLSSGVVSRWLLFSSGVVKSKKISLTKRLWSFAAYHTKFEEWKIVLILAWHNADPTIPIYFVWSAFSNKLASPNKTLYERTRKNPCKSSSFWQWGAAEGMISRTNTDHLKSDTLMRHR
jgi:hypothetical protein